MWLAVSDLLQGTWLWYTVFTHQICILVKLWMQLSQPIWWCAVLLDILITIVWLHAWYQYSGTANFEIIITESLKSFHVMHDEVVMLLCKALLYTGTIIASHVYERVTLLNSLEFVNEYIEYNVILKCLETCTTIQQGQRHMPPLLHFFWHCWQKSIYPDRAVSYQLIIIGQSLAI